MEYCQKHDDNRLGVWYLEYFCTPAVSVHIQNCDCRSRNLLADKSRSHRRFNILSSRLVVYHRRPLNFLGCKFHSKPYHYYDTCITLTRYIQIILRLVEPVRLSNSRLAFKHPGQAHFLDWTWPEVKPIRESHDKETEKKLKQNVENHQEKYPDPECWLTRRLMSTPYMHNPDWKKWARRTLTS